MFNDHAWLSKTKTREWMVHVHVYGVFFCLHTCTCTYRFYWFYFVLSVEELSAKVEDGKDEIRTLKRKHGNNVKVGFISLLFLIE